jgi:hypothetical protein
LPPWRKGERREEKKEDEEHKGGGVENGFGFRKDMERSLSPIRMVRRTALAPSRGRGRKREEKEEEGERRIEANLTTPQKGI